MSSDSLISKPFVSGMLTIPALLLTMFAINASAAEAPCPSDLNGLRELCGDGALAYAADGRIYLTELSTGETVQVGNGNQPEFSPDSSKLAWIDGTTAKGRMRKGNATNHTIAANVDPSGGVHWINDSEVVVVLNQAKKHKAWHRISLAGEMVECPELTELGTGGGECDVKLGEDGVWSYVIRVAWKTSDGRSAKLPGTCSVSLSPDGKSATSLHGGHERCSLTAIREGGVAGTLPWNFSHGFDNHRWSSNDPRFLVVMDEASDTPAVITADGSFATRMGERGKDRNEMYGDFTVGDGNGAAWTDSGIPLVKDDELAWPSTTDGLVFLWENAIQSNTLPATGSTRRICRLLPQRRAKLDRFHEMDLSDGCFLAEDKMNEDLLTAWKASNAFSIEALIVPRRGNDGGTGIIASFASHDGQYMFVLGQKADSLAFRVHTDPSQTGGQPLSLCQLEFDAPQHIVVTVSSDGESANLVCYKNGRQVFQTQLEGSLSNWGASRLGFGDPARGNFDWAGRLEGVALYNRALDAKESQRHQLAYAARIKDREPAARLVLDATLRIKRPIPRVAQYPEALVVYDYAVDKIVEGSYDNAKVLVAHWGALNGHLQQAMNDREVGGTHRLVLERFEEHPELRTIMIVENQEDFDLPMFYEVAP